MLVDPVSPPLEKFDDAENVTDQDQDAGDVERDEDGAHVALENPRLGAAVLEDANHADKHREQDQLQQKRCLHHVHAHLDPALRVAHVRRERCPVGGQDFNQHVDTDKG